MERLNINVNGNRKLRNTDKIRFIIWNLPAVKTCPYSTELCKKSCYARKAERIYPQVLPAREKNYIASLQDSFVENMIFTIEKELNSKKYNGKLAIFRIHESGDFYSPEYTEKWVEICKYFENDNRIKFLAYTKSILYFVNLGYGFSSFPSNLVIRSSLWKDTKQDKIDITSAFNFPIYTALTWDEITEEKKNGKAFYICKCDDCANCRACWNSKVKNITCEVH